MTDSPEGITFEAIWFCERLRSAEHFRYSRAHRQHRLAGVVILPRWDDPVTITYRVVTDAQWRTISATVALDHRDPVLTIEVDPDGSMWSVDGTRASRLDGCTDLDLGWTPATNTLPVNRLNLNPGEAETIRSAWLRFPELDLVAADQTYERIDESRWIYRSGPFSAELTVDQFGFVRRYGDDLWRMVLPAA